MSRRLLAVALAVVMIAAVVVVLVPASTAATTSGGARPATPAAAVARPAQGPAYELFNGYGYYAANTYYLGEVGWDTLNFYVYDDVDHDVNVTITDPNATRDGVSSPAFTYEAKLNTTTDDFYSAEAGVQYTFPNLAYGGTWVVNFSAPVAGYVTQNVTLEKYYVDTQASVSYPQSVLPGDPISVFWWAYLDSNGNGLFTGATSVWIMGHYHGNGTYQNFFPGGMIQLTTGSWGQWNGTVPLNATADTTIQFEVWVITSVGGVVAENESDGVSVAVGQLWEENNGLTDEPAYCLGSYYLYESIPVDSTAAACIQVGSEYSDYFTPIAGLPVTIGYWNGTTHVTPTGGAPTSGTTNSNGVVEVTFNATAPPFTTFLQYPYYDNAVNFSVTVPGANSSVSTWTGWDNITNWAISPYPSAAGVVNVELDHTEYFAGTTATATWSIESTAASSTGPITADVWTVVNEESEATTYASGTFSGAAQSGTFTFAITSAMVNQAIEVVIYASNATLGFYAYAYAEVIAPTLLLTPGSVFYTEGSSPTVTAALAGSAAAPAGTTIAWQEWAYWEDDYNVVLVASGTVANGGTITFPISSTTPPQYVEVDAWATTAGVILASSSTVLQLETGYSVLLGVGTVSNYADGSFQPGQTVTLNYQLVSIDGTALPQTFSFSLFVVGLAYSQSVENVAPTGSVAFTIPSNAPAGTLIVMLQVTGALTAGPCVGSINTDENACTGITTLLVNPSPSVFNLELGAGSGLTVGWLVLLIIVILVAIVLYVVLRRRGGSRSSTTGPPAAATESMSPPAPAPSTGPPAAWSEPTPASSGGAQPPLPPPPGSS
jgi:hypothetical protein